MASRKLRRSREGLIVGGMALIALFAIVGVLSSQYHFVVEPRHYLVLHTLLELAGILVSFAVFVVNWEASKQNQNAQSLFVATGFLGVAALSTMHVLSYEGMPDFVTPNGIDKTIYYYLSSSLWAAGVLWAAAHVRPDASAWFLHRHFLVAANLLVSGAVFAGVTLYGAQLPPMFVEGEGLTSLKVALEFIAVGISVAAVVDYMRLYRSTKDEYLVLVMAALVAHAFVSLAFAVYQSPSDAYHLLGHAYKVVAYYLIFRALLVSSVQRPYDQLQVAKDRLEHIVAELDARNRELDALDDVAVALSGTLKPDEILESAIDKVMKVMRAGAGAIFLLEEGTDQLRLTAWRGLTVGVVEECQTHTLRLTEGAVPLGHNPDLPPALEDSTLVRRLGGALARTAPLGTCTCAPIVSKGRLLGAIAMVGKEERNFAIRDADLLTAVGYQLGLAIENAQLYEQTDERLREKVHELQRAERRSRFLSEVGALLGSGAELARLLDLVARKSAEVMGDACALYLLDDREKLLRLEALFHTDGEVLRAVGELLGRRAVGIDEGVIGQVARTGEPVLASRVSREELAVEAQQLAHSVEEIALLRRIAPTSRIVAPMRARGRTVGVLVVMSVRSRQLLGEADLSLVMDLADRVGVAVENTRLFQESQAQRRHLEAIISQMVDGVVITDEVGEVSVANASAQRMLGEEMEHLLGSRKPGRPVGANLVFAPGPTQGSPPVPMAPEQSEGSTPPGRTAGRGRLASPPLVPRALAGHLVLGESVEVSGAGGVRVLSASASPVRDDSGEIAGAVVVLRDVTAEREVERMKEEFVAVVSHELRTPITAVLGYTDILLRGLRGPLTPKQVEALGSVRGAAQRLLALINDLLDMSRLEAGRQELSLAAVDLFASTDHALSVISVLAASKGIRLVHSVPRSLPRVLADEEQLQRILGNLLSNAIKFTPEGGTVSVSAQLHEQDGTSHGLQEEFGDGETGSLAVMISDTGVGIPLDHQEKIWDKFQQVDSSSRRLFGGTGLGLAITKSLVELHGGKVWVESEGVPGRGSTFWFTLPIARSRK